MKISQKQKQELIISWCFSLVPLIALFETYTKFVDLGMNTGGGEQNAALFPRMISFLLLFLIGINTVRIFIQASNSPSDEKLFRSLNLRDESVLRLCLYALWHMLLP